ncbi:hypothetical protein [Azotobacter chroococcum]|uniref:Uncharacterized protein n=1 Tax=Azotobacter chroococcum TaxID=353 RepID=A0AAQ0C0G6_9GAMM|nr:hypothetical protein [Azotobacter chroococcum]QQE90477.1 hypothetical protein GKQ51_09470 [Azotobacter chroococcum]
MNVQVIDTKTGNLKTMPRRYAEVLVKMKRARWPESNIEQVDDSDQAGRPADLEIDLQAEDDAPKRRGRKSQIQE